MLPLRTSCLELTARQRVERLLEADSFHEFLDPTARMTSPHLANLGQPVAFDDGLVTLKSPGSHTDMDAATFLASIRALKPDFVDIAHAGHAGAPFAVMRRMGPDAERRMMAATGGVNTHRGAIFVLGVLAAAAGHLLRHGKRLTAGSVTAHCVTWQQDILVGRMNAPPSRCWMPWRMRWPCRAGMSRRRSPHAFRSPRTASRRCWSRGWRSPTGMHCVTACPSLWWCWATALANWPRMRLLALSPRARPLRSRRSAPASWMTA